MHYGTTGILGSTTTWNPNGASGGVWIEGSADGSEGGGFFANGNTAVIWSPGDAGLFHVYDEDQFAGGPEFTIDGSGNVLSGDDDNIRDLGSNAYSWNDLWVDGGIAIDGDRGTSGQVLHSDGTNVYWGTDDQGVTSVTASNGLTSSGGTTPDITLGGTLTSTTTITQGANNMIFNLTSTGDFNIQDNGTSAFFVRDDGNVGIGTTGPTSSLHITGTVYDSSPNVYGTQIAQGIIELTRSASPYIDFKNDISTGDYDARLLLRNDDFLHLQGASLGIGYTSSTTGSTGLVVVGNVGIGTSGPVSRLHVNGDLTLQNGGTNSLFFENGAWDYYEGPSGYDKYEDIGDDYHLRINYGNSNGNFLIYDQNIGNLILKLTNTGDLTVDGTVSGGGADLAERFDYEGNIEKGDIVAIDPDNNEHVILCTNSSQNIAGIVSTNPGFKLNTKQYDESENLELLLYPNPATNQIVLELSKSISGDGSIRIFDVSGRLVYLNNYSGLFNRFPINISKLAPGIYYIKLNTSVAEFTEKFIVE